MSDRSDSNLSDQLSDCPPRSSTPFAYSATSERFEYPFPLTQSPPSHELHLSASSSTQTFARGSIAPLSAAGRRRGMSMGSFASPAESSPPPRRRATLPYPPASAAIGASQSLMSNRNRDTARVVDVPALHPHHLTASQLCSIAATDPPMPPSLVLKRRSIQAGITTTTTTTTTSDARSKIGNAV